MLFLILLKEEGLFYRFQDTNVKFLEISLHGRSLEILKGEGDLKAKVFKGKCTMLNWNFLRVRGLNQKELPFGLGGKYIFCKKV